MTREAALQELRPAERCLQGSSSLRSLQSGCGSFPRFHLLVASSILERPDQRALEESVKGCIYKER